MLGKLLHNALMAFVAAVCCGGFFVTSSSGFAQDFSDLTVSDVEQVSLLSTDNRNPRMDYMAEGARLAVVWDGIVSGQRRILLRERSGGVWLDPVIVDSQPAGNNASADVKFDAAGNLHVVWIADTVNGQRQPIYGRRLLRESNSWYSQPIPFPEGIDKSRFSADYISLKISPDNQPWAIWQYGYGNLVNIACTRFGDSGLLVTDELTPGATGYNISPELFFRPQPVAYWYTSEMDQFYLIRSEFLGVNGWAIKTPENLEELPTNSLPHLFRMSDTALGAAWYDRAPGQVPDDADTETVYLGTQSPETQGRGEPLASRINFNSHSINIAGSEHGKIAIAWVSENYKVGEQIVAALGSSAGDMKLSVVSELGNNRNPAVVSDSPRSFIIAWEHEENSRVNGPSIVLRSATSISGN